MSQTCLEIIIDACDYEDNDNYNDNYQYDHNHTISVASFGSIPEFIMKCSVTSLCSFCSASCCLMLSYVKQYFSTYNVSLTVSYSFIGIFCFFLFFLFLYFGKPLFKHFSRKLAICYAAALQSTRW